MNSFRIRRCKIRQNWNVQFRRLQSCTISHILTKFLHYRKVQGSNHRNDLRSSFGHKSSDHVFDA